MAEETTEDLPGFGSLPPSQPTTDPLDPEATTLHRPLEGETTRPRVSGDPTDNLPPVSGPAGSRTSTSSTTFSEVEDALAEYGASGFYLASLAINKAVVNRTKQPSNRWLATEDEVGKFGMALGRVMARRVPEELVDNGDTADYLIMGSAVLAYAIRCGMGLSADDAMAAAEAYMADQAAQQGAPAPPPGQYEEPPTAPPPRVEYQEDPTAGAHGTAPATPPPPAVITPGI